MKKKILFIMMFFITLSGSYKEEAKAANSLDVVTGSLSSKALEPPSFNILPEDITVKKDDVATITAQIYGTAPITIYVYLNDKLINNETWVKITSNKSILSITIKNVKSLYAGTYTIFAENKAGSCLARCTLTVEN